MTCLYAQISGKDSLCEIASGLLTNQSRLYHLGMKAVAKSTLVAYIKFITGIKLSLTEITIRIRDALMMNYDLMEILRWDRKTILKPPDWNRPRQMELFGDFLC